MANFQNHAVPVLYAHIYQMALSFSKSHQGSPDDLFKELWDYFQKLIKGSLFVDVIKGSSFGAYQLNINEYLSLHLTHALQKNGLDYSPEVTGNIDDIQAQISKKNLLLSSHFTMVFLIYVNFYMKKFLQKLSFHQSQQSLLLLMQLRNLVF
jgi:hypothetical protein